MPFGVPISKFTRQHFNRKFVEQRIKKELSEIMKRIEDLEPKQRKEALSCLGNLAKFMGIDLDQLEEES